MLNQLKENMKIIYNELDTKLLPANIRKGVTILNVEGTLEQSGIAYSLKEQVDNVVVSKPDSGSYMFALNSDGYYESNNNGVSNSYSLCKVTFNALYNGCSLVLDCINYAENNCDFGILSKLDTELSASNTVDSTTLIEKSFKGSNMSSVQRYIYNNVSKGKHFIYIKYRKDSSSNIYNDSFQFKVIQSIDDYQNVKIYSSIAAMNNDIEQLNGTYATIDIGNQVFENFYKYDEATKTWNITQLTTYTAGVYENTNEFKLDTLHYGTNYIGVINQSNSRIPLNIYKTGRTKLDTFDDIVTLSTAIGADESYHIDNLIGTEEDYWRGSIVVDLTQTKFRLEQYYDMAYSDPNVENYILEYESTDGITYTQSKNTFEREVNIYNDELSIIKGNYDNRIGEFLYSIGNVFGGLYYKSTATSTPTRLTNQLYCVNQEIPNDYTVYGNNGVVTGTLYDKLTGGSDITYKFNVYGKLKEMLEDNSVYNDMSINLYNYKNKTLPITTFGNIQDFIVYRGNLETANLTFGVVENNIAFQGTRNLKSIDIIMTSVNNISFTGCTNLETIKLSGTLLGSSIRFDESTKLNSIDITNLVFGNNLTSLSNTFIKCKALTNEALPELDTSLVTSFSGTFSGCELLTEAPNYDYSNNKSMFSIFSRCTALVDASNTAIQGPITSISSAFSGCTSLVTIPQYDLSNFTSYSWDSAFSNCTSLSDDSLNNILATLTTAPDTITSNKTLKYCGLNTEQCYKCTTLSNYQAFIDSGWTTGYTDDELAQFENN